MAEGHHGSMDTDISWPLAKKAFLTLIEEAITLPHHISCAGFHTVLLEVEARYVTSVSKSLSHPNNTKK